MRISPMLKSKDNKIKYDDAMSSQNINDASKWE